MNAFKRAFLYITRKSGKTLLLTLVLLVISSLVLSGLAALDAEEQQSTDLRGATGTSFTVERNESWGNEQKGKDGGGNMTNTSELISKDMVNKIAGVNGIKGHNVVYETILQMFDQNSKPYKSGSSGGGVGNQFRTYGSINSEYSNYFLANKIELIQGRHLTGNDENGILISEDVANQNGLKVGDKIKAVNDPQNGDPYVELEILGIFKVIADKEDVKDEWSMDAWYDYSRYAFVSMNAMEKILINYPTDGPNKGYISADFYVDDPQQLESIIQEVQNIGGINWKNFKITANDKVYERAAGSMSNISSLIRTLLIVIVIISAGIVTLILGMWVKGRIRETGILLAAGISKASILFQHILEVGMIAVISFPLSYLFSRVIAGGIGGFFGKTGVVVTTGHFGLVCGFGALLLVAAILLSCIPMMRLKPKEILTKMS